MQAFRYISYHYLRYFVIIMFALILFSVGFDYMEHSNSMPKSANLVLIYLMFKVFFAIDMLLPLSLIFAMIATKVFMIRSNALVALFSLGYSRIDILKPFVVVATTIITIYVALHATPFARADEYARNISQSSTYIQPTSDLFFTFEDKFVYFGRLYPLQERAENIRVFQMEGQKLKEVLVADSAYYYNGSWNIELASSIEKPVDDSFEGGGIIIEKHEHFELLRGFRPKILDQVYVGKVNFTIFDAMDALILFTDETVNVDKIKSALYHIFIYPLFVPSLIVIIFFFVPVSSRFLNVTIFSFGAILATLATWAILFMLSELSNNKMIPSEAGIVLPVILLFMASIYQWHRHRVTG